MTPATPVLPETPAPVATAATAATAVPGAVARTTGTPAFDAILLLQTLSATPELLSTEAGETADLFGAGDSSDDEDSAEELEASLAFLAQLLTATATRQPPRDFGNGAFSQGQPEGEEPATQQSTPAGKVADVALPSAAGDAVAQARNPGEALLASAPPEPLEARASGDASQNLARAAEILSSGARPGTDVPKATLSTPVRDPRWADELGARVQLMVRARESSASLQLTPLDLGPVEVNVTVKDTQATVHFGASQAETRALLEAAMPRLREMLAAQGFQLMDSSVSSGFARSGQGGEASGSPAAGESETSSTEARPLRAIGLLDVYA